MTILRVNIDAGAVSELELTPEADGVLTDCLVNFDNSPHALKGIVPVDPLLD